MYKSYTTTLSSKELRVIEMLLADYGNIVNFSAIYEKLSHDMGRQEVKNFVSKLVKKGWLIRVKRGIFVISSNIAGRGSIQLSQLTIAQILDEDSYVSFEGAWQFHGLFDQYLRLVTSVGKKRAYSRQLSDWIFKYIKFKKGLFFGFERYNIDGRLVNIASKEKAVLDFLTYRRDLHSVDLVIEKLREYRDDFDMDKLVQISQVCSITARRMLGVIFDLAGIDSSRLHEGIRDNKSHSFMTAGSDAYDAKWKIYIDKRLKKN